MLNFIPDEIYCSIIFTYFIDSYYARSRNDESWYRNHFVKMKVLLLDVEQIIVKVKCNKPGRVEGTFELCG